MLILLILIVYILLLISYINSYITYTNHLSIYEPIINNQLSIYLSSDYNKLSNKQKKAIYNLLNNKPHRILDNQIVSPIDNPIDSSVNIQLDSQVDKQLDRYIDKTNNNTDSYQYLPQVKEKLTIIYLKNELKINEQLLMKYLVNYSWIFYLKVDRNIKPTIETLKSFGLKDKDIRIIISSNPSILGINYDWTLPEKIISIQKMYILSKASLIRLLTLQPYLLTCSIDRNLLVNSYLTDEMGFEVNEVRYLIMNNPKITMIGINALRKYWHILTMTYKLSNYLARKICLRYPYILSNTITNNLSNRLTFFTTCLSIYQPDEQLVKLITRYPPLLTINVNVFLLPNYLIVKKFIQLLNDVNSDKDSQLLSKKLVNKVDSKIVKRLTSKLDKKINSETIRKLESKLDCKRVSQLASQLDSKIDSKIVSQFDGKTGRYISDTDIQHMIKTYPSLLGYNPLTLQRILHQSIYLLTGIDVCECGLIDNQIEGITYSKSSSKIVGSKIDIELASKLISQSDSPLGTNSQSQLDMEIDYKIDTHIHSFNDSSNYLTIPLPKALTILLSNPWIIAYRPERSTGIIRYLANQLHVDRNELNKIISMYPRILSFSVDGKISSVIKLLSTLSTVYLTNCPELIDIDLSIYLSNDLKSKCLMRQLIVRYPLLLGTSIDRIASRINYLINNILRYDDRKLENKLDSKLDSKIDSKIDSKATRKKTKVVDKMDSNKVSKDNIYIPLVKWSGITSFIRRDDKQHNNWINREIKKFNNTNK